MSKSKARKLREKLVREGKRNPESSRSSFAMLDLNTRRTKTKQEKLNQVKHKKQSFGKDDFQTKDCFLFRCLSYCCVAGAFFTLLANLTVRFVLYTSASASN
ncbi:hypothetical protein [Gottfriedia acidiceleris]|uniref:Uncharacterized protein n=1 Tax=Gottfriedia acidiceleris TaxID=371036 RepID=A0ABY4JVC0_9BACI|nr:hypothetical protein [Gottfriedia acidiceleris]UPM56582.1 hypothetical protein MY490_07100 [Gottfriedia acidiceleris]